MKSGVIRGKIWNDKIREWFTAAGRDFPSQIHLAESAFGKNFFERVVIH